MKLYEYALIVHPTEKQKKAGDKAQVIEVDGRAVNSFLAKDEKHAGMLASRKIPDEFEDRLDQVQIAIRPF